MARPPLCGRVFLGAVVIVVLLVLGGTARRLSKVLVPPTLELPAGSALQVGSEAPDFHLPTVDGDELSLISLRGQVVLVDFWATWCGPCRQEMRGLQRLHADYAGRGVEIVAISVDAQPEAVGPYARREGLTFPVLLGGVTAQVGYRVTGLPTLFVVDRNGMIRYVHVGYAPGAESVLAEEVETLLAEG